MVKPVLLGIAESAAHGARLAQVEVVSHTADPFSSEILSSFRAPSIESKLRYSAVHAAIGASLGGRRAFVTTSSMTADSIHFASHMRVPLIAMNMARPLGSFSSRADHSDIMNLRDSGSLIFMPENNTELVETIVQAYKVAEESSLPAVVGVDTKDVYESVMLPNEIFCRRFVGKFHSGFSMKKPAYFGGPSDHADFRKQQQKAMTLAVQSIEKSSLAWKKKFKRTLPMVDPYRAEDADYIIVMAGYNSTTARASVEKMRKEGRKVGLLRLRVLRPWPSEVIANALQHVKKVVVLDQSISIGSRAPLFTEISASCRNVHSFVNLGNVLSEKDFRDIFDRLQKSEKQETVWL